MFFEERGVGKTEQVRINFSRAIRQGELRRLFAYLVESVPLSITSELSIRSDYCPPRMRGVFREPRVSVSTYIPRVCGIIYTDASDMINFNLLEKSSELQSSSYYGIEFQNIGETSGKSEALRKNQVSLVMNVRSSLAGYFITYKNR